MSILTLLRNVVTRQDSLVNTLTGLGGSGDKGVTVAVDTSAREFSQAERDAMVRKDGYLASWHDRMANESVLTGWDLKTGAKYLRAFEDDDRRLKVAERISEALRVAFKDGGALIVAVTDDAQGPHGLRTPLDLSKVKAISAIHVFDRAEFQAYSYEQDIRSPNWRSVNVWQVTPTVGGDPEKPSNPTPMNLVHHTRCFYIPGRPLWARIRMFQQGVDDPLVTAVWDGLKDQRSVDQGGAVLAQEMKESVIKLAGLGQVSASVMAETFMERLRLMAQSKGLLGSVVLGEGDEYHSQMATATGYKDLKAGARSTWAAYTQQPETIAYGATPGGLNTDGEAGRKSWDRRISQYQRTHVYPCLLWYYGMLIHAYENSGEDVPDRWDVVFRHLGTLTRSEEAQVKNTLAMMDRIYVQTGVLPPEFIREHRFGDDGYQFDLPPFVPGETPPSDPTRALAGPQVRGLLEIVLQAAVQYLPPETAKAIIKHSFQFTDAQAEEILGGVGTTFTRDPVNAGPQPDAPVPNLQIQGGESENAG